MVSDSLYCVPYSVYCILNGRMLWRVIVTNRIVKKGLERAIEDFSCWR